ncbi:MAG: transcriptional regulator [Flavobacteriaceae bacterium]|nr:transcriptional regulator [Flavobacteriaceae bacterium]
MKKRKPSVCLFFGLLLLLVVGISCNTVETQIPVAQVKIALRSAGNLLLLSQNDSTSLVLPVVQKNKNTFQLSFEDSLGFDPADLNTSITAAIDHARLPKDYVVEVLQCSNDEVAYSYKMSANTQENSIPCGGRVLPKKCYTIALTFTGMVTTASSSKNAAWFYILVALVLAFLGFVFYSKYHAHRSQVHKGGVTSLGIFSFYPEENKLVKEAQEIPLTQKESDLLAIFIQHPNVVVKREELTKKVWEDHGVIVGRSLDTYISKLRKKLQEDTSIKLTNVHGVGYKLEIL